MGKSTLYQSLQSLQDMPRVNTIVLPKCDLAAFYDNTIEFRRFAIYKNGKLVRVSHDVPMWYEKFIENVK